MAGAASRYERRALLEVQRRGGAGATPGPGLRRLLAGMGLRGGLEAGRALARSPRDLLVVGLRQARDAAHADRARHQAIIETPLSLRRRSGGGWLRGAYDLRVHPLASHPIVEELGLAGGLVPAVGAAWARFDLCMQAGRELWSADARPLSVMRPRAPTPPPAPRARRRVAILGGGIPALTAAHALTDPALGGRYEVTVYQPGWRLGGKGASGRNQEANNRIEEHGLHVWYGFYDNAFRVMRACYEELGRPAQHPLATLEDAFLPQSYVVLNEQHRGRWIAWRMDFPRNHQQPGSGDIEGQLGSLLRLLMGWQARVVRALLADRRRSGVGGPSVLADDGSLFFRVANC